MTKQVAVFVGSSSQTSFNHLAVSFLKQIVPTSLQLNIVEIADLPLYDRDLDDKDIPAYNRVREAVKSADAVIWVSPEHNGSYSAMLKNAVDVVSRPVGQSMWIGKPVGLLSLNARGSQAVIEAMTSLAQAHYVGLKVSPVTTSIGGIFAEGFADNGELVNTDAKDSLQNFISAFDEFVSNFEA